MAIASLGQSRHGDLGLEPGQHGDTQHHHESADHQGDPWASVGDGGGGDQRRGERPDNAEEGHEPGGEGESDLQPAKHVSTGVSGLVVAADAQKVGQIGREHGETTRIDRGDQTGSERNREIEVEHNLKVTGSDACLCVR